MPEKSESKNPFINGSKVWVIDKDGRLCIRCGYVGHIGKECKDEPLPSWEQAYLKEILFGQPPQVSFAQASYVENDGGAKPYGSYSVLSHSSSSTASSSGMDIPLSKSSEGPKPPAQSTENRFAGVSSLSSPMNHSIGFGVAGLSVQGHPGSNPTTANNYYGEGSGPNKRPRRRGAQSCILSNSTACPTLTAVP